MARIGVANVALGQNTAKVKLHCSDLPSEFDETFEVVVQIPNHDASIDSIVVQSQQKLLWQLQAVCSEIQARLPKSDSS